MYCVMFISDCRDERSEADPGDRSRTNRATETSGVRSVAGVDGEAVSVAVVGASKVNPVVLVSTPGLASS